MDAPEMPASRNSGSPVGATCRNDAAPHCGPWHPIHGELDTRPVSNDVACRLDAVVQIVPLTSLPDRDLRPYESHIDTITSGLERPSRAVANQLRTVARHRVIERLGHLDPDEIEALDLAVRIQLGLRREP